ncbi:hypothetical protein LIER_41206 [Lithospermum erythrorhizon]|uniref:CCHC-type domain-containing protein n=1 Tax=Lithospermum erythrorhizon TaxID=34254 RepID=A0AAV3RBJ8_LITER
MLLRLPGRNMLLRIYSHLLELIRGPLFWPNLSHLPTVLPPIIHVLPEMPKKCRTVDANEKRKNAEKSATAREKANRKKRTVHFKNSRKGTVMHCKLCGGAGHNKKGCQQSQQTVGAGDGDGTPGDGGQNGKKRGSKRKWVGTSMFQPVQANPGGDGSSTTPAVQTQSPSTSRKSKKSRN